MASLVTGRRGMVVALTALTVGALALLLAANQWQRVDSAPLMLSPDASTDFAADAARACGWLALTGIAGVLATRGWLRTAVGVVLLLAATMSGYVVVSAVGTDSDVWRWVAIAGCLAIVAAALLVVTVGHRWPSLSRRYDAATGNTGDASALMSEPSEIWRALDRGDDPT